MITVIQKNYENIPINQKEVLRYLGIKNLNPDTEKLLKTAYNEFDEGAVYKVCYAELPIKITDDNCDFSAFSFKSKDLAKNLSGTESVIVFGATIGIGVDRLINKYSKISPALAVVLDAVGSERIEALCDKFCEDISLEYGNLKPRFSAGYGDLPIEKQKEIFALLGCDKKIGLTLNDSYIMSPSKSVTAFVGIIND